MTSSTPPPSGEQTLAGLIERLTDRLQAGETLDPEALAREHPGHADDLRRLLPALQGLAAPGVLGEFRLIREVGRGGMGVVYEAEQTSLRRRVAVKVLPLAATMDPRQLQRFKNEARAAASLEHPHIVPVFAVGCDRGVHFYAMKFIDGQSLEALLRERRAAGEPVSFRRAALWGIQAAEALESTHGLGIVHRDIKPANLLIDAQGGLWVADFGLARTGADAGLTMTGDLLGTLRYMSPEQALGRRGLVDHRTDVYALGATLYELLTLRPAFDGKDRGEVLRQIIGGEPAPPRRLNRAVPRDLETVVLKALAREPAERYASAQELADDLARFLVGEPVRARPVGWLERAARWCRRNPALGTTSVLAASLLVTATAVAVGWTVHASRLAEENRLAWGEAGRAQRERRERGLGRLWMARRLEAVASGPSPPRVSTTTGRCGPKREVGQRTPRRPTSSDRGDSRPPGRLVAPKPTGLQKETPPMVEFARCNGVPEAVPLSHAKARISSLEAWLPMSSPGSVTNLIEQVMSGEPAAVEAAAKALWEQYAPRLLTWVRHWLLSRSLGERHDESAVSVALAALIHGMQQDKFSRLHDRNDLWRLLLAITENKIKDLLKSDARQPSSLPDGVDQVADPGPSPDIALSVQELLDSLGDATLRAIAWAKLEGYTNEEIAAQQGCAVRTIERKIRRIRQIWDPAHQTEEDAQ